MERLRPVVLFFDSLTQSSALVVHSDDLLAVEVLLEVLSTGMLV